MLHVGEDRGRLVRQLRAGGAQVGARVLLAETAPQRADVAEATPRLEREREVRKLGRALAPAREQLVALVLATDEPAGGVGAPVSNDCNTISLRDLGKNATQTAAISWQLTRLSTVLMAWRNCSLTFFGTL